MKEAFWCLTDPSGVCSPPEKDVRAKVAFVSQRCQPRHSATCQTLAFDTGGLVTLLCSWSVGNPGTKRMTEDD